MALRMATDGLRGYSGGVNTVALLNSGLFYIRSANSGARISLDNSSLSLYNASDIQTLELKNDGSFTLKSADSGARIRMTLAGLAAYDSGGTQRVNIANDGTFWFGGSSGANSIVWNGSSLAIRGSLTADDITAGTLSAERIGAGTISGTHIAAGSITSTKLNVTSLSAISADMGTITAGTISAGTVNADTITSGSLGSSMIRTAEYGKLGATVATTQPDPAEVAPTGSTDLTIPLSNRIVNKKAFNITIVIGANRTSGSAGTLSTRLHIHDVEHDTHSYSNAIDSTSGWVDGNATVELPVSNNLIIYQQWSANTGGLAGQCRSYSITWGVDY